MLMIEAVRPKQKKAVGEGTDYPMMVAASSKKTNRKASQLAVAHTNGGAWTGAKHVGSCMAKAAMETTSAQRYDNDENCER